MMLNSMMLSMIFMTLSNPISLGFVLILQTILISMISSMYSYSFWMSYILFLIMVGGMLILFTYVTSIASNEKFYLSFKPISFFLLTMLFIILTMIIDKTMMLQMSKMSEMNLFNSMNNLMEENSIMLNKMYNKPSNMISFMLINYLFMTLIIAVKITNLKSGPIRQKF
uniref:NADH-ubiquinone oxidoreductase chain 6 n=1 Tax=Scirtes orbicularis TaxID=1588440 RepID=A0A343C3R7_9COLE|nr:NADH dehydrogenase subunit 6 [Scirtes orbicularis]